MSTFRRTVVIHPPPVSRQDARYDPKYLPAETFTPQFMQQLVGMTLGGDHTHTQRVADTLHRAGVPPQHDAIRATWQHLRADQPSKRSMVFQNMAEHGLPCTGDNLVQQYMDETETGKALPLLGRVVAAYKDRAGAIKGVIEYTLPANDPLSSRLLQKTLQHNGVLGYVSLTTQATRDPLHPIPFELSHTQYPLRPGCIICPDDQADEYLAYPYYSTATAMEATQTAPAPAAATAQPTFRLNQPRDERGRFRQFTEQEMHVFREALRKADPQLEEAWQGHETANMELIQTLAPNAEATDVKLTPQLEQLIKEHDEQKTQLSGLKKELTTFKEQKDAYEDAMLGFLAKHERVYNRTPAELKSMLTGPPDARTPPLIMASLDTYVTNLEQQVQQTSPSSGFSYAPFNPNKRRATEVAGLVADAQQQRALPTPVMTMASLPTPPVNEHERSFLAYQAHSRKMFEEARAAEAQFGKR